MSRQRKGPRGLWPPTGQGVCRDETGSISPHPRLEQLGEMVSVFGPEHELHAVHPSERRGLSVRHAARHDDSTPLPVMTPNR